MIFQESTIFKLSEEEEFLLENNIKFSFLPKFNSLKKRYPEYGKYTDLVKKAEVLVASTSSEKMTMQVVTDIFIFFTKIEQLFANIGSAITLPLCIFIFPIVGHLITRAIAYLWEQGEYLLAKQKGKDILRRLNTLKTKTTDKSLIAQYDKAIKDVSESLNKIDE